MARDPDARIRELEQKVRKLEKAVATIVGSESEPVKLIYLRDGQTGAIAKVDFDDANSTVRTTKVR